MIFKMNNLYNKFYLNKLWKHIKNLDLIYSYNLLLNLWLIIYIFRFRVFDFFLVGVVLNLPFMK